MTYTTFTPDPGAFINNVSPLSASVMNAFRAFCLAGWFDSQITSNGGGIESVLGLVVGSGLTDFTAHSQSVSGSTSGTLTINEWFTGSSSLKIVLAIFSNYKNAGSAFSITLNAAFTTMALLGNFGGNGLQIASGGSAQTVNFLTSLGSTSAGNQTSNTTMLNWSVGSVSHGFDTIKEPGSNAVAATGIAFFIGY